MNLKTKRILVITSLSIFGLTAGSVIESIRITGEFSKGIEAGLGATLFTPLNLLLMFGYMPIPHLLCLCIGFTTWALSIFYLRKRKFIGPIVTFLSAIALGIPNSYLFWAMISV